MLDVILIILNILCVIGAVYIVRATDKNTAVRREHIKQIEKESKLLDEMIKRIDTISELQASYQQVTSKLKVRGEAD
jgi:Tfp pilus assembly protein PilN